MKFNCANCGDIDYVIIDGYDYGDRLLEGVTFEVRRDDNGKYHAQVEEFSREYFSQFNQQMYLNQIEEGMDAEEFAICPTCGEEVLINKVEQRATQSANLQTFAGILGMLGGPDHPTIISCKDEDADETSTPAPAEEEETTSTEGGDTGGGGASENLDEPEKEDSTEETEEESDEEKNDEDES